ncbi:hypothetical protein THAOC_28703, partial [Thalassiosira oceanica]
FSWADFARKLNAKIAQNQAVEKHHEHQWPPHLPSQHPIVQPKSERSSSLAHSKSNMFTVPWTPSKSIDLLTHISTLNIRSGRNGGLVSACRALDLSIVACRRGRQQVSAKATWHCVTGTIIPPTLNWRSSVFWPQRGDVPTHHGSGKIYYCVSAYIPPSDDTHAARPKGFQFILLGNLNINLDAPRDTSQGRRLLRSSVTRGDCPA